MNESSKSGFDKSSTMALLMTELALREVHQRLFDRCLSNKSWSEPVSRGDILDVLKDVADSINARIS